MFGFAQTNNTCKLNLKLVDQQNYPKAFIDFWMLDLETKSKIYDRTNEYGNAELLLDANKSYSFNFRVTTDYMQIDIPDKMNFMDRTILIVTADVNPNPPDTVIVKNPPGRAAKDNEGMINQTWIDKSTIRIKNMPVSLYDKVNNKEYICFSDELGNTRFLLPEGKYLMSVGLLHNYKEIEIKKSTDMVYSQVATFIRTNIPEKITNDTIVQTLEPNQEGTSESGLFLFKLRDFDNKPLSGETVWIDVEESDKVYQGVTDSYGVAKFLLPKGPQYTANLKYSRSIEHFGFPIENNNNTYQFGYVYMGSKFIESYYQEVKRTVDGFQTEFKSIPVTIIGKPIDVAESKPYGFNLNFKSKSACSPPVIAEDKIFISGGYYSRQFFGFNVLSGKFVWGIELAEAGASPAVYEDGTLLIITESCTLYAIEAATGKLLWSKWLGPYMYTTPTAANGIVYTVYQRSIYRRELVHFVSNPFVIVAFDLKSGNIIWQKGIDSDIISSPVLTNDDLYLSTVNGSLYRFDNKSGKLLSNINIQAVNQPTIFDKNIFLGTRLQDNPTRYQISVLDTSTLSQVKNLTKLSGLYESSRTGDIYRSMNFMDGRVVNMQGKNYCLIDGTLACYDARTFQEIWSKKLGNYVSKSFYSTPTVLKNMVLVPTGNGKILVFDPNTGRNIKTFTTNYSFWSAPIVHNGWIYISTVDGQLVSINTKDAKNFTGWQQWGKDATHNLLVK